MIKSWIRQPFFDELDLFKSAELVSPTDSITNLNEQYLYELDIFN